MAELKRAIKHMKTKGAAGLEDDIPPTFLKALGQEAMRELLTLFNMSFNTGKCPQEWQNAVITPLLKADNPSSKVASFRPVSLTFCIVKTLEGMIAARISYLAETNDWFSDSQAGFRRGRSCEDQVIRMSQSVSDGCQKKKPERTVMALVDFSPAYDRVSRQDLLLAMLEKGVPRKFLRWIAGFLQNRQGRVRFANSLSRHRTIRQGVPQGSGLAPLLFLFYIDPLTSVIPAEVLSALFEDDVSVWATDRSKEEAGGIVQQPVDNIVKWVKEKKMLLNTEKGKTEVTFFAAGSLVSEDNPVR